MRPGEAEAAVLLAAATPEVEHVLRMLCPGAEFLLVVAVPVPGAYTVNAAGTLAPSAIESVLRGVIHQTGANLEHLEAQARGPSGVRS